jgi:DeoR/GlpR family transcriptional regulator of sugar metabolism
MTERQKKILDAIVEQYAEVASPVGSTLLAKLFNVSSATIRAEMAELEHAGFIKQVVYQQIKVIVTTLTTYLQSGSLKTVA